MAATTLNARRDRARIESLPISGASHRCILAPGILAPDILALDLGATPTGPGPARTA